MVSFHTMTAREAKEFLARFVEQNPQRLAELRVQCAASGGPAPEVLDLSPRSLGPLWEWARPQLSWREGYVPPLNDLHGPRGPVGELEPFDQLPEWFDPLLGGWVFSAPTLWLIDGMARYLGEALTHNVPGSHWRAGRERIKSYAYQNHPVVDLPTGAREPLWSVSIITRRALSPSFGPSTLTDLYTAWTVPHT